MALSLDATLAAAQDNVSRRPLVEILSSSPTADIPFDGQKLTTESTAETAPNAITHSSGRLCVVYTFGSGVSAQLEIRLHRYGPFHFLVHEPLPPPIFSTHRCARWEMGTSGLFVSRRTGRIITSRP
jgi:hypothetical protein